MTRIETIISIPVSVLQQSTWKFCMYLYFGLFALLLERHLLHAFFTFCIVRGKESASLINLCRVLNFLRNSAMWDNLSAFYNSSPALSVTEAVYKTHDNTYFIFKSIRHFGYPIVLQYHTVPAGTRYRNSSASSLY